MDMKTKDYRLLQSIGRELNNISTAIHVLDLDEIMVLSKDEFERLQSIQKAISKLAFDVNIRLFDFL